MNKYGVDNHDRVWLEFFDSREEAFTKESEMITEEFLKANQSQCMNLKPGGSGGWGTSEDQKLRGIKGNKTMQDLRTSDEIWVAKFAQISSDAQKLAYENGKQICGAFGKHQPEMAKRAQSDLAKAKRAESHIRIEHQQGSKNSQFGTCWVSNNVHTVKIKLDLLDEYISKGYTRGRKLA